MSNKHNLVLYVDEELVRKSRELGFNLSKTLENHLKHLITQFSQCNQLNNPESIKDECFWWAGPDLNPDGFESRCLLESAKNFFVR